MNKLSRILLAASMLAGSTVALAACNNGGSLKAIAKEDIKIGLICLHDENSTYDLNFIEAMNAAVRNLGLNADQLVIKKNIEEGSQCYDTAAELADDGCNIIFADSFGHESYIIEAAKEFKDVRFCHATGVKAHTEKLENYYNAFADIYQGRYLAGIAGGMKLKAMVDAGELKPNNYDENQNIKIGYVGAWPYAEVKSGYTSWYLGVKSVVNNVVMDVTFTNSWYSPVGEQTGAENLIARGCALISQHADSMGAPNACKEANVPNVSYNGSTEATCSGSFIVSSKINWAPYYEYVVNSAIENTKIDWDYCGTIEGGSVVLTDLGAAAVTGTQEAINAAKAKLVSGELKVFDTSKFTVGGKTLETYKADVDDMGDFQGETEVVKDGYFHESEYRSAPYFDVNIDGINNIGNVPATEQN
ncbi:MAG: BMP family ABC transporter substrate-binding protein [Bacilli bacterium]|nr:BMP family ABC transporter substrate-binding protein [Bacilli bacterium]